MLGVADKPKSTGKSKGRGRPAGRRVTWDISARLDPELKPLMDEFIKKFNARFKLDTGTNDHLNRAVHFYFAHGGFMDESLPPKSSDAE